MRCVILCSMKGKKTDESLTKLVRDEDLVRAYQSGELKALNTLLELYDQPLRGFIRTISWVKGDSFIDDVIQEVRIIIFTKIKSGGFIPDSAGSFKKWAYKICQNITWKLNKDRARREKPISEYYPEEPTGMPDDLLPRMPTETKDYDGIKQRLNDALSELSLEEQKLMRLVAEKKSYKEIRPDPFFRKYSLDYLMLKVYNIRKKMLRIKEAKYGK